MRSTKSEVSLEVGVFIIRFLSGFSLLDLCACCVRTKTFLWKYQDELECVCVFIQRIFMRLLATVCKNERKKKTFGLKD